MTRDFVVAGDGFDTRAPSSRATQPARAGRGGRGRSSADAGLVRGLLGACQFYFLLSHTQLGIAAGPFVEVDRDGATSPLDESEAEVQRCSIE